MSKTVFLADLHLDERREDISALFFRLLAAFSDEQVSRCYILGDLFEYWLGDDCQTPLTQQVAKHIRRASEAGCAFFFIHGNRDFLLADDFAKQCQMTLLPEHAVVDVLGEPTLLAHGDTLCTDDVAYMQFRERVRTPEWQRKITRLPRFIRRWKAKQLRKQSQRAKSDKPDEVMDVNQQTVEDTMATFEVKRLIHGHTHRAGIHCDFQVNNEAACRYVVGDWHRHGSVLVADEKGLRLLQLKLEGGDDLNLS